MTKTIPVLLLAAAIASPAGAAARETGDVQLQKMLVGREAGKPVSCIPLNAVSSSEIIDGKAIVYRAGSKLYVNQPRSGAEQLSDNDILVTQTSTSQLCSIDSVRLVDRSSYFPRGFVVLDEFVPYTKVRAER